MSNFILALEWEGFEKDKYVHTVLEDNLLPPFITECRWFAGKAKGKCTFRVKNVLRFTDEADTYFFCIFEARYQDGTREDYLLPLSFVEKDTQELPEKAILTAASLDDKEGFLVDAIYDNNFRMALLNRMKAQHAEKQIDKSSLQFSRGKALTDQPIESSYIPEIDSSNSAFIYDDAYFLKLYRKLFDEINPEVETVEFITQNSDFANIPRFGGGITWYREHAPAITIGMMVEVIDNEKDNWSKTGDYLNDFLFAFIDGNFQIRENVFDQVGLLAKRTAEMHLALFSLRGEENFRADMFDRPYRRYLHEKVERLLDHRYNLLTENYLKLDEQAQHLAWTFMDSKDLILDFVDRVLTRELDSFRTRIHGDYHLGQVLVSNNDFIIIDFEGEPESSISERKIKHSPLKDVAGMIRSYHYAVSAKLYNSPETNTLDEKTLQRAADRWYKLIRDTFLEEYLQFFGTGHTLFKNNNEINYLLQFHLLEKSVYELGYEINYRPTWVKIPLKGIVEVIKEIEKLKR